MSPGYHFGPYRFDVATQELWKGRDRVPLEPRPARILKRLLSRAGDMVDRRELRELGWPRLPHVADQSLNTCMRQIRAALDDDVQHPRFIETLRGRGYRFVADVSASPREERRSWKAVGARPLPVAGALALAGGVAFAVALHPSAAKPPLPREVETELRKAELILDRLQDPMRALAVVEALAPGDTSYAPVQTLKAELLLMVGRHSEAHLAVRRGLELDERDPVGHRVAGNLAMLTGRWDEAERALNRALEEDPSSSGSWVARAYLSTIRGRFSDAERAIARALELDPLSPLVHNDVGILHLWAGRYDRAADSCREVIGLLDDPPPWAVECVFDALRLSGSGAEEMLTLVPLLVSAGLVSPQELSSMQLRNDPGESIAWARLERLRRLDRDGARASRYALALAGARVGEVGVSLDALEEAARRPGFGVLSAAVDPRFAVLRDEPRFRSVVIGLGL